ncbi:MAG: suppressor of fused domain protein [Anaerofustis sp.]
MNTLVIRKEGIKLIMSVLNDNKVIAKYIKNMFGKQAIVSEYRDDENMSSIDILSCSDVPIKGVTSYSTIGLSEYSIGYTVDDIHLGIEILGVCESAIDEFANIMASCAFNIINSKYTCSPGTIFPNVISPYYKNTDMRHIFFTDPFIWENTFETLELENKKIAWLMVVPISDNEMNYCKKYGAEKLEVLFEHNEIDIFNMNRKSVV